MAAQLLQDLAEARSYGPRCLPKRGQRYPHCHLYNIEVRETAEPRSVVVRIMTC